MEYHPLTQEDGMKMIGDYRFVIEDRGQGLVDDGILMEKMGMKCCCCYCCYYGYRQVM